MCVPVLFTQDGMRLQIVRRGAPPTGRGEVILNIPTVRSLRTVHLTDPGRVKRVRGVAYGTKVRSLNVFPSFWCLCHDDTFRFSAGIIANC